MDGLWMCVMVCVDGCYRTISSPVTSDSSQMLSHDHIHTYSHTQTHAPSPPRPPPLSSRLVLSLTHLLSLDPYQI